MAPRKRAARKRAESPKLFFIRACWPAREANVTSGTLLSIARGDATSGEERRSAIEMLPRPNVPMAVRTPPGPGAEHNHTADIAGDVLGDE